MEERKLTKADIDKVRHIEGFPIAKDEDIIALSRPPYYTACPNPFIEEFIRENGTPYDEATDDYHREPFAQDVIDSKYDPIYQFHPYHTKIPYRTISKYVEHYTEDRSLIFDGFCGSGMTAVGVALLQSDRKVICSDISPFCTFISYVTSIFGDTGFQLLQDIEQKLDKVEIDLSWLFETHHAGESGFLGKATGRINFTIWSDVFVCPSCSKEYVFWDVAADYEKGTIAKEFSCPHCRAKIKKADCTHAIVSLFDPSLGRQVQTGKQIPVLINYTANGKRYEKKPDENDIKLIETINESVIPFWHPTDHLPNGDNTSQAMESHKIEYVHQFYTRRNLWVLAALYNQLDSDLEKYIITKVAFRITKRYGLTYQSGSWGAGGGPTNGTLYIPSLSKELNIVKQIREAISDSQRGKFPENSKKALFTTQSSTDLSCIPNNCID